MYKCKTCEEEFESFGQLGNHVRWKHKDNSQFIKNIRKSFYENDEKTYGRWINEIAICSCDKCNNETIIKYREGEKKEKILLQ